jgi:hypothetical protein
MSSEYEVTRRLSTMLLCPYIMPAVSQILCMLEVDIL